jgi:hypothetical protein
LHVYSAADAPNTPKKVKQGSKIFMSPSSVTSVGEAENKRGHRELHTPTILFPDDAGEKERLIAFFMRDLEKPEFMPLSVLLDKMQELDEFDVSAEVIGNALNRCAEKFSRHDFFIINRFDAAYTALSAGEKESINAELMGNWRKWYTYKLLASCCLQRPFSEVDRALADKVQTYDALSMYAGNPRYPEVEDAVDAFYLQQLEVKKEIEDALSLKGIVYYRTLLESLPR